MVDRRGFAGESEVHGLAEAVATIGVEMDCDAERIVAGYLAAVTPKTSRERRQTSNPPSGQSRKGLAPWAASRYQDVVPVCRLA